MKKEQLKTIIKSILLEDAILEGGTTKCSVCGAPVSAKALEEKAPNAKCPYCKNPYNWELYIRRTTQKSSGREETTTVQVSGTTRNRENNVVPIQSTAATTTANPQQESSNPTITKFAELLKEKLPNEERLDASNALASLFKEKHGDLYNDIISNSYDKNQEENILKTINEFSSYAKKILDKVGANPNSFPRGRDALERAISGKYFKDSDWYKQNIKPKEELLAPFFFKSKLISVLTGLLSNRDEYLNGLNNLNFSGLKMSLVAEAISNKFAKKLISIL